MRTFNFFLLLFFVSLTSYAQTTFFLQDLNGQPIKGNYSNVSGSPYLFQDWKQGSVVLGDKKRYDNIPIKYDIVRDVLIFKKDNSDAGLEFNSEPVEFKFDDLDNTFLSKRSLFKSSNEGGFLELIYNGKLALFKKHGKRLVKKREYNSAITEQQIEEFYTYFVLDAVSGKSEEIKSLNEKALLPHFGDKAEEVKKYSASNKLSFKKDADLTKILNYYNSIK